MRKRTVWLSAAVLALLLTGCGQAEPQKEEKAKSQEDKLQIGLSFDSFVIERWIRDRDVFMSTAQELGAEVNFQNANGDPKEQISQIEYFIKKKMDVIVIIAIDDEELLDVVKRAREEGIKVVSYDRLIRNGNTDLYISFDNEQVGRLMAQQMVERLPKGSEIFLVNGSDSDYNVDQVVQGIEEVLDGSGIEVTYTAYCENWLAELAFDAVNEGLEENDGHVDGIICGNDDLAHHAIQALTEHRLAEKVVVVGQDAELSACQRILEGTQVMTVYKSVDELARKAAILSVALAKGEDITSADGGIPVTETFDDGSSQVPYVDIEPVAVTAENMDEVIIDSGFHAKEDVYLNVK